MGNFNTKINIDVLKQKLNITDKKKIITYLNILQEEKLLTLTQITKDNYYVDLKQYYNDDKFKLIPASIFYNNYTNEECWVLLCLINRWYYDRYNNAMINYKDIKKYTNIKHNTTIKLYIKQLEQQGLIIVKEKELIQNKYQDKDERKYISNPKRYTLMWKEATIQQDNIIDDYTIQEENENLQDDIKINDKIKIMGVYKIENTINNKVYIGESMDIEKRWDKHKEDLINNCHHSWKLQKDFNKSDRDINIFDFKIIRKLTDKNTSMINQMILLTLEESSIKKYDSIENGYNCEHTLKKMLNGKKPILLNSKINNKHIEILISVIKNMVKNNGKYIKSKKKQYKEKI